MLLALVMPLSGTGQSLQSAYPFHSPAPAGYQVIMLLPWHSQVSILGLVECREIEGLQRISRGNKAFLISPDGARVEEYPREFNFRVTATLRKTLLDPPSESVTTTFIPQQFLMKLRYKLKVYRGLERRVLFPQSVKIIGVPADLPYDERVYRVKFDVDNLAVTDRMVLEVLSPQDELLTHFSFGLL